MENVNEFMLMFRFTPNFDYQPTQEELSDMRNQWGEFIGNVVMQEKLVYTHQLGFEGKKVNSDLTVKDEIVIENNFTLGGNMVVKANSIEEATEIAKGSPILKMGGTVEIRNIIPMN
ncbi:MAG: YciI family protein [Flavobacteriales bacterium]|nr:YciI family protein [Flavobacteriales bacterium]